MNKAQSPHIEEDPDTTKPPGLSQSTLLPKITDMDASADAYVDSLSPHMSSPASTWRGSSLGLISSSGEARRGLRTWT